MTIYAGLDKDGTAKLFTLIEGRPAPVDHQTWLDLTEHLQLRPGEMPKVYLMPGFRSNTADRLDRLEQLVYSLMSNR